MPNFRYKAVALSGRIETGSIEAVDRLVAISDLQAKGYLPIQADLADSATSRLRWRGLRLRGVSARSLGEMLREFAVLLKAGLPLDRALDLMASEPAAKRLQPVLTAILGDVRRGSSLAEAIHAHPSVFSTSVATMIEAGDAGGTLDISLDRAADMLLQGAALRDTLTGALLYPMILLIVSGLSLAIILTVVIPEFKPLFEDAGVKLPLPTRIVMSLGDAVAAWWFPALAALAIIGAICRTMLKRPSIRLSVAARVLRLPFLGDLVTKIEIARFARTLGALIENGIPLPTALGISNRGFNNMAITRAVERVGASLKEGEGLSGPLRATRLFPRAAIQLIMVGEETARLGGMLERLAEILEREVHRSVQRALTLMTPLITVGLGVLIAGIIASILVAILSINDLAM